MAQLTSRTQQGCSTSQRTSLVGRGARSCVRSTAVRCFKSNLDDNGVKQRTNLRVNFKIPYRVNFGQSLGLVGSGDALGNWDPKRTVRMKWTDGDWWTVELNLSPGGSLDFEYKYVVVNQDGNVGYWKPGGNYRVTVPLPSDGNKVAACVKVADAWDESFKEVNVEEAESTNKTASSSSFTNRNGGSPSATTSTFLKGQNQQAQERLPQKPLAAAAASAAPLTHPPQPLADVGAQFAPDRAASNGTGPASVTSATDTKGKSGTAAGASAPKESAAPQASASQTEDTATNASQASATTNGRAASPRSPPPTFAAATTIPVIHPSLLVEQERLEDGVRNSLEDLQTQMDKHQQLRDRSDDPAAVEILVADRIVAAANNRVVAYNKALKAVQEYNRLPSSHSVGAQESASGNNGTGK